MPGCLPTTCSIAARYSRARPPCATITIPITPHPLPSEAASPVARSRSRWRIDTCHPSPASVFASASTSATERCRPPVQPSAEAEIALPLRLIGRQQERQQIHQPRVERRIGRIGLDEGPDRRVAPVARPQRRIPVRVLQETHVDHHVRPRAARRACRRTTAASPPARRAPPPRRTAAPSRRAARAASSPRVSISTSARSRSGASSASSRSMPIARRLVRAERMPPPGLAVAPHQRRRVAVEIDQHRRPPGRRLDLGRAPPAAGRPRTRGCAGRCRSRPGARPAPPANSRGRKLSGRLSIASKPRSSSAPIAVERPAPAGPLMMTMCCPAQGVLPRSPCTPCPTNRPCLPQSGKARPFCTKMVNATIKIWDFAPGNQLQFDSQARDCHRLWHSCRGRAGRDRPPASATPPAPPAARRIPTPRASISPASRLRARGRPARRRAARSPTRSSATSAAPRPISASASADLPRPSAENQHAPAGERHRRAMHEFADASSRLGRPRRLSLRTQMRKQPNTDPNSLATRRPRFRRREFRH